MLKNAKSTQKGGITMYLVVITTTEIYIMDALTRTLFDNNGNEITHGFLRTMFYMSKRNIIAVKNFDYNGNCMFTKSRKAYA